MPNRDHFPPDIMDKAQAFTDAINAYLVMAPIWEKRFNPNQLRIPAGQPGGGQWTDGDGAGLNEDSEELFSSDEAFSSDPASGSGSNRRTAMEMDHPGLINVVYRPGDRPPAAAPHPDMIDIANLVRPQEEIWRALEKEPTIIDPNIGRLRPLKVNPSDATRPDIPYIQGESQNDLWSMIGPAPEGSQRHHVVPVYSVGRFFDRENRPETVHNSSNIIIIPEKTHWCVTGVYNTKVKEDGTLFREEAAKLPFIGQYKLGLDVIEECEKRRKQEERVLSRDTVEAPQRSAADLLPKPMDSGPPSEKPPQSPQPPPILPPPLPPPGGRPTGSGGIPFRPGRPGNTPRQSWELPLM